MDKTSFTFYFPQPVSAGEETVILEVNLNASALVTEVALVSYKNNLRGVTILPKAQWCSYSQEVYKATKLALAAISVKALEITSEALGADYENF